MTDLALEYTGGINAPTTQDIGLAALVDSTGLNLRYGRDIATPARDATGALIAGAVNRFEVAPQVILLNTTDATVTPIARIDLPLSTLVDLRLTYLTRTAGDALSARWLRRTVINVNGVISTVGAVWDEQSVVDPTGIAGVSFTNLTNAVQVNAAGKAATSLFWILTLQIVSQLRINR